MHPIERLRYVARSSGADQATLVRETAGALAALGFDPPGLVTACRRILARHPGSGPMWWLAARMLTAVDSRAEAWAAVDEITSDRTPAGLAAALPDEAVVCVLGWPEHVGEALARRGDVEVLVVDALGEGSGLVRRLLRADLDVVDVPVPGLGAAARAADVVLLEATAVGGGAAIAVAGSLAAAAVARHASVPVWLVAGVGRALPERLWGALVARLDTDDRWELDDDIVPLDLIELVVGPAGSSGPDALAMRADCPVAPELLRAID